MIEWCVYGLSVQGDVEAVRKQLSCGVDPNVKDFAGWTPLVSGLPSIHLPSMS